MPTSLNAAPDDLAIPLHSEEVSVKRYQVPGTTARVHVSTREQERLISEDLTHERVEIERVPIGRVIETIPPVREDGDTTIMSVVEETIVVERRLVLKEEVHIRRFRTTEHHRETVMVREQNALITRVEADHRRSETTADSLRTDPTQIAQEQQR